MLSGSRVGLWLDTGHLLVGGVDPVALARSHTTRVKHVHLKDVDATMATAVRSGELTFGDAVRAGIFCPLGDGDVDIAVLIQMLETAGYADWYELEQDVMLDGAPQDAGPVESVRRCLHFLEAAFS